MLTYENELFIVPQLFIFLILHTSRRPREISDFFSLSLYFPRL